MCKISVILIIGLLLGCSSSDNPLAPPVPESLIGEYTGTVSYWQYKGTDSSVTASAEIEFSFMSDTTYYYSLPGGRLACSYGGTKYEYDNGSLDLKTDVIYRMFCGFRPLQFLVGTFRVTGAGSAIILHQKLPELDLVRTVELNRVSQ